MVDEAPERLEKAKAFLLQNHAGRVRFALAIALSANLPGLLGLTR